MRGLTNWGVFHMPKATKGPKGSTKHHVGHYYVMRFDASPKTQHMVRRMLGLEPRLLRFSCVRLGRTLRTILEDGDPRWKSGVRTARRRGSISRTMIFSRTTGDGERGD